MLSKKLVSYAICRKSCVLWNMRYAKCDIQYVCIGEGKGVPACEMQTVGSYFIWGQAPNCAWVRWPFADFPAVFFPICHETQQLSRAINCLRANMAKICSALGFCRFLCCVLKSFAICHETQQLSRAINCLRANRAKLCSALGFCRFLCCSVFCYLSWNTTVE